MPDMNNVENGRGNIEAENSEVLGCSGGGWEMDYFLNLRHIMHFKI